MTTIFSRDVDCAHCGASNTVLGLSSTNAFGSMDLDMRPPPMQRGTLAQQIHECTACGYCAPRLDVPAAAREALQASAYHTILADETLPRLARRFVAHAFLMEAGGHAGAAVAAWRNAAWVCDDALDAAAASRCRCEAVRLLDALHREGDRFTGELDTDAVLGLDLLRRGGRHDEVIVRAGALLQRSLPPMLASIAEFERRAAGAGDVGCYRVSDVVPRGADVDA